MDKRLLQRTSGREDRMCGRWSSVAARERRRPDDLTAGHKRVFAGCVVRLVVEGSISFFLLFVVVLLCLGANHSLCGSVFCFVFAVLSTSFFLMQRHVKSCSRKKHDDGIVI
jgi:hypothetical protein